MCSHVFGFSVVLSGLFLMFSSFRPCGAAVAALDQRFGADEAGGGCDGSPRRRLKELATIEIQLLVRDFGTADVRRAFDQHWSRSLKHRGRGADSVPGQQCLLFQSLSRSDAANNATPLAFDAPTLIPAPRVVSSPKAL